MFAFGRDGLCHSKLIKFMKFDLADTTVVASYGDSEDAKVCCG